MDGGAAARLFDANAASYDRVNRLISLGLDSRWRDWAARRAVTRPGTRVLDVYCGTGLVGLRAAEMGAQVTLADASPAMLAVAEERLSRRHSRVPRRPRLLLADVERALPVPERSQDAMTIVFGVRYMDDPVASLGRLARCLAAGGRLVVVEFVEPGRRSGPVERLAGAYFFGLLPRLAAALAGSGTLYRYLVRSTAELGRAERLEEIVGRSGLTVVESRPMGFGLVRGIVAVA